MKIISGGLSSQAPVTIYDKTKPYLAGRVFSKNIGGTQVYGPPLLSFINVQNDTAAVPGATRTTPNGRMFVLQTITTGVATFALYDVDLTGQAAPSFVGKLLVRVPNAAATTHTLKGFEVYDGPNAGTVTGWQIYLGTTATVVINGGLLIVNNISKSDFVPISPATIEMAVASNAKAVYMVQDPASIGVNNTLTAMQGLALDRATRRLYFHNNVLATTQFVVFDPSATPNLVIQTASANNANGTATTFNFTAHGYSANDPVVLLGTVPTGFTASNAAGAQTVYFVRNQTANTFELSATTGGASILGTSVVGGTQVTRAFGQSVSQWLNLRTGTITGIAGTILLTNCEQIVTPLQSLDPALPAALNNQTCLFFSTNSGFYLFKVSDITNGATTFPSLSTANNNGNGSDFTAQTPTYAVYVENVGRVVYISNTSQFYVKRWVNNIIDAGFGAVNTTYYENAVNAPYSFAFVLVANIETRNGFLICAGSTVGQRGVLVLDFSSDAAFNVSYVTSPVFDTSDVGALKGLQTVEKLFDLTSSMTFSYKTKALLSDVAFNDPSTGWTTLATAADLSAIAISNFTQLRIDFGTAMGNVNTPAQINEILLSYLGKTEVSENWVGSVDNTTQNSASPAKTAFRLIKAYTSTVPRMFFRAYDDAGNLVVSADTTTNPTLFEYTTNNGTSWNALGTVPNTPGTTELRYNWATPPGVRVTCSLRES